MKPIQKILFCWALGLSAIFFAPPAPAAGAGASEIAKLAEQAQAAFKDNHYPEAVKIYERLAEQAPGDANVLYNLGTAHARAGQRGLAIWRYLQALRLDPRDADLRANLRLLAWVLAPLAPMAVRSASRMSLKKCVRKSHCGTLRGAPTGCDLCGRGLGAVTEHAGSPGGRVRGRLRRLGRGRARR